jgi:hypothetical protein
MWYPPKKHTEQLDAVLASLESKPAGCEKDVGTFLVRISTCIHHLTINELVPPSYLRDWIWIGSQFRINAGVGNRIEILARRALLFLIECFDTRADKNPRFREDVNWVTDSTVSELVGELGPNSYNSFLSPDELQRVERRLQDLRQNSSDFTTDEETRLQIYLAHFSDIMSETYLPSISHMVQQIHEKLVSNGSSRGSALACLRYIVEEGDVVRDSLGYLGLVDDIYAIELTYREIGNSSAWGPLLEKFNSRWPYLNRLAFEEDSKTLRFSTYMQAIFGTAMHGLTKEGSRACLVLPEAGICGLIAAFLASIESIRNQASFQTDRSEFVVGECILLGDADRTITAQYAGKLEFEGINYQSIQLRGGGKVVVPENILAIAQRAAKPELILSTAKEFSEWKKDYSLTPLTHLIGRDVSFENLRPEVLLVTRRNRLNNLVQQIKPMGKTIPELVGMKYVASTGTEENLPGSMVRDPLIWSCSDANTARELISSADKNFNPRYVIVDEADLAAELEDNLMPGDIPSSSSRIILAPLHEMEVIPKFQNRKFDVWLLKQSDVEIISNPIQEPLADDAGVISRYQRRQVLKAYATSEIRDIQCEPVEFLYEYVRDLRKISRATDDTQRELAILAASAFVRRFIRSPLKFDEIETQELKKLLANLLSHCAVLADYYSDIHDLAEHIRSMLEKGIPVNPRQAAIEQLIARRGTGSIAVVCPSGQLAESATRRTSDHAVLGKARWLSLDQLRQVAPIGNIIIPGWLDRRPMRELRNTAYATHIDLVLYDFEREWETKSRRAARSWEKRLTSRMRNQWNSLKETFPDLAEPTFQADERVELKGYQVLEPDEPETDRLQAHFIDTIRKQTSTSQIGVPMAKGRLVMFEEPGTYIYLPPYGSVISLSRMLDSGSGSQPEFNSEKDEIDESVGRRAERLISCSVGEITAGDLLAFPTDSRSNFLGSLAIRFIPEPDKTMRLANLWRTALKVYLESTQKSIKVLGSELEAAGLKRHPFTIKMWVDSMDIIAPMNYADAITAIAKVTANEELGSSAGEVRSAIDLMYRARGKAAAEILKQMAGQKIELNEGTASVRVEGHEILYRLQRVLTIDPPTDVSQDAIGVLNNITDFSQ